MESEPINLGEVPVQDQISLDQGVQPPPQDSIAKSRASKADIGLSGVTGNTFDDVYKQIQDGNEAVYRQGAASKIDEQTLKTRQKDITDLAAKRGSMLSLDEVNQTLHTQPTNPDSVIEKAYGQGYVAQVPPAQQRIEDNTLSDIQANDPDMVDHFFNHASETKSRLEYMLTRAQNLSQEAGNDALFNIPKPDALGGGQMGLGSKQGWLGGVPHAIGNIVTLGNLGSIEDEWLMRGNVPGVNKVFTSNILKGDNVRAQALELLRSGTFDEFKTKADKAIDNIKYWDIGEAAQWAHMIAGMSTDEMIMHDAFSAANLTLFSGAVKTAKGLFKSAGDAGATAAGNAARGPQGPMPPSSGTLVRQADGTFKMSPQGEQAQRIMTDVLTSSPKSPPDKINLAEAVGDSKEAGVQKALTSATSPDPKRDTIDTLMDSHRVQQTSIDVNPGGNSREVHTRLMDAGATYEKDLQDTILGTTSVIRLPSFAENGFRDLADEAKQYFRGKENMIVNMDMIHDPWTNTEHHVVTLGNYDAEPYPNKQTALNAAKINGWGTPKVIGEDAKTVYIPKSAVLSPQYNDEFRAGSSLYTHHEDGTTTRHNSPRSIHTGYVTPEEHTALGKAVVAGKYAEHLDKGELRLYTDKDNGVFIHARKEPEIGLHPVEILPEGRVHYGKPIADIRPGPTTYKPNPNFHIEEKDGLTRFILSQNGVDMELIPSTNPTPTHIPYNTETKKFGEPLAYGPHIVPKGLGYHIEWHIPLNETQDIVRDGLITNRTASASSTNPWFGPLGYLRPAADTLGHAMNENMVKTTYSQTKYLTMLKRTMKPIEDLFHGKSLGSSKQWDDLKRSLVVAQKYPDPDTGLPGYYLKTPAEIQDFWMTNYKYWPSEAQQQAYLAVQRLYHADLVFRSIAVYKNKSRLGTMEHTFINWKDGVEVKSQPVEGRFISKVPQGDKVVIIHDKDGFSFYNTKDSSTKKHFDEQVKQGVYKGIQIYDPDKYQISIQDKEGNPVRIAYVFSKSMDSNPISYAQIKPRGGGHWDYDYNHYIKQPSLSTEIVGGKRRMIYSGDATYAPINVKDDYFLSKLNEVKNHLKNRDIALAKAAHLSYSDQPWKEFVRGFYPRKNRDTGVIEPARFNMKEDFHIVPRGMTTLDLDKSLEHRYNTGGSKFVDATREESLAKNFQVEYTGKRDSVDLFTPQRYGSVSNPMYKFQPAELVDPITAMTRAVGRITNSLFMDDFKISAIEHFLQENKNLFRESDLKLIRSTPFSTFNEGPLSRHALTTPQGWVAESNRYKIKKFLGMPSAYDKAMHSMKQQLADHIMNPDGSSKTYLVPMSWTLSATSSGPNFVRGMAFHENLGLYNWMQLAAQNAAWVNFFGLSPKHAMPGSAGAWMHLWSTINSKGPILKTLGTVAEKIGNFTGIGWKAGEWEAAREAYLRSGYGIRGNTSIYNTSMEKQNFFLNMGKTFLRNGTIFFDLAEQNVRHGAWYTAYHEYIHAYPNSKIDDVAIGKIMRRADDMYMNMGRNSRTMLNSGITSMPLQFFKYQENVAHAFLGKRIGDVFGKENTWQTRAQQRAQMIAMYSLAFGPLGATGLSMLPINDVVRKKAIEWGYHPGDNFFSTLMMEGPMSMAGAYASGWWRSGSPDMTKGTFYNFNNRYGANGYQIFRDILEPSSTYWKILLGASGSTMANTLASLSPFTNAMYSALTDQADNPFRLTQDDWLTGLQVRNVNSMRYSERLAYALAYGEWRDRHGAVSQQIDKSDAIFRSLLGTNDVNLDDLYLKGQIEGDRKENEKTAEHEYQHYRRLAEEAIANNDTEMAKTYNKNAVFAIQSRHIPSEVYSKFLAHDATLNKTIQSKTDDNFYLGKSVPTDQKDDLQKTYQNIQQQKAP